MSKNSITGNEFRGYQINSGKDNDLPCYTKTLDQIIDTVEHMVSKHSKVLSVRLDIRSERNRDGTLSGKDMTRVIENVTRTLQSNSKHSKNDPDPHFVWAQERKSPEDNPHYHVNIFVNGNAIQNGYSIKEAFNKAVKKKLDTDNEGLVHFSSSNGKVGKRIERNSPDFESQFNDVVYTASYLAKTRSKEHNPKGSRVSSSTRIRKK